MSDVVPAKQALDTSHSVITLHKGLCMWIFGSLAMVVLDRSAITGSTSAYRLKTTWPRQQAW